MKNLFLTLTTILSIFVAFSAQAGTSQTFGGITYHDFDNGLSGTSQTFGDITYHDFDNGLSGTSQTFGDITYHDWN
jgi:hypothetical protein